MFLKRMIKLLSPTYRKLDYLEGRIERLVNMVESQAFLTSRAIARQSETARIISQVKSNHDGNRLIADLIGKPSPCMISRIGGTELGVLYFHFLERNSTRWSVQEDRRRTFYLLNQLSGFFPLDESLAMRFCVAYTEALPDVDLMALWNFEGESESGFGEIQLRNEFFSRAILSRLFCMNSWDFDEPWTGSLEGKKVLIVHPFKKTIEQQYHTRRKKIFPGTRVLPEFESLVIVESVQSIAGNAPSGFETWFDALEDMKDKIAKTEFDVALIGAGAYGLPLASHVKRLGKKAVHMGGELQFLFGIKGRRWVVEQGHSRLRFMNEHWVYPCSSERPANSGVVEGGCYW